jgi:hypothetical protein
LRRPGSGISGLMGRVKTLATDSPQSSLFRCCHRPNCGKKSLLANDRPENRPGEQSAKHEKTIQNRFSHGFRILRLSLVQANSNSLARARAIKVSLIVA